MRDIGKNIRDLRLQAGLNQDQLAERLYVTRQTISNYENGRTRPDVEQILRIAEIFDTDANTVLYGLPVPDGHKRAYLRTAVGGGITLALWAAYCCLLVPLAKDAQAFRYDPTYSMLLGCAVKPLLLLLTGWVLSLLLRLFVVVKLPQKPWVRHVRRTLFAVSLCALLLPAVVCVLLLSGHVSSVSWQPLIALLLFNIKVPHLYFLPGAALGFLNVPPERAAEQNPIST